jgi:hypothetical protein
MMTDNDVHDMMEEMHICPSCHDHTPCGCEPIDEERERELIHMTVKVCTGCRKLYEPIMEEDGDCCPSCARY